MGSVGGLQTLPPGSSIRPSRVVWKSCTDGQEDERLKTGLKGGRQAGTGALELPRRTACGRALVGNPSLPLVGGPGAGCPYPAALLLPRLCSCPTRSCTPPTQPAFISVSSSPGAGALWNSGRCPTLDTFSSGS